MFQDCPTGPDCCCCCCCWYIRFVIVWQVTGNLPLFEYFEGRAREYGVQFLLELTPCRIVRAKNAPYDKNKLQCTHTKPFVLCALQYTIFI